MLTLLLDCRKAAVVAISLTILAILAKVQSQAGKDGKDLQYIIAKLNNLCNHDH